MHPDGAELSGAELSGAEFSGHELFGADSERRVAELTGSLAAARARLARAAEAAFRLGSVAL